MRGFLFTLLLLPACSDPHDWTGDIVSNRAVFVTEDSAHLDPGCSHLGTLPIPADALAAEDENSQGTLSSIAAEIDANYLVVPKGTLTGPSASATVGAQAYSCPQ